MVAFPAVGGACDGPWVSDYDHQIYDEGPSTTTTNVRTHKTNKPKTSCYLHCTNWGGNSTYA
jgi:hypothetical protein